MSHFIDSEAEESEEEEEEYGEEEKKKLKKLKKSVEDSSEEEDEDGVLLDVILSSLSVFSFFLILCIYISKECLCNSRIL